MNLEPPSGSRLSVTTDGADPLIVVPHFNGGLMRYFFGLLVLAFLGNLFAGFMTISAAFPRTSLGHWLVGWAVAAFMVYWVYRAFRPSVPESLRLMPNSVTYDSGTRPLLNFRNPRFRKRTRAELDQLKLQSLRLRETNDGNRLTVDADALRLDIAQSASEIDREWLYQLLANRYSLPLGQGNALADGRSG